MAENQNGHVRLDQLEEQVRQLKSSFRALKAEVRNIINSLFNDYRQLSIKIEDNRIMINHFLEKQRIEQNCT